MHWRSAVIGFVIGLALVPLVIYLYLSFGLAPVATAAAPLPFEKQLTHMAMHARVEREAPHNTPNTPNEQGYLAGAKIYREDCAVCHGLPGQNQTDIGKGMFPKPPQLFKGKGVTDDPAGETYWKVKHGIRLSGMPGFDGALNEDQMWQVSQLLANADKLPASVQQELRLPVSVGRGSEGGR